MASAPWRFRLRFACVAMAAGIAWATPAQSGTILKASHPFPFEASDPRDDLMRQIGREIAAAAPGLALALVDIPGQRSPHEIWKALARGDLDMAMAPLDRLVKRHPRLEAITLPGMVARTARLEHFSELPFLAAIGEELDRAGLVLVARTWIASAFVSVKGCVLGPATIAGHRTRTAGAGFEQALEAAGARIAALPITEIYPALQTGVLDTALFSLETLASLRLGEQAKCLTVGGQADPWLRFVPVVMTKAAFQRLDASQRAVVMAAGRRAAARFQAETRRREQELVASFVKAGVAVKVLSTADADDWIALSKASAHKAFLAKSADGDSLLRLMREAN